MNSIIININPVVVQWGNLSIYWYGIAIAAAILAALWVAVRESRRKGIPEGEIYSLALWTVIAGFVSARLFHVVDNLDYYWKNPGAVLALHQGGLAIWGGVAGGVLAGVIYGKIRKLPLLRLADAIAPALLLGQIIGRFGCLVNGDAYGGITNLPWGFVYTHPDAQIPSALWGVSTHPYPVYEMLWSSAILILLFTLGRRWKREGWLFFTYLSLYSLERFFLTFVRQEKVILWGLQQAQIVALLAWLISFLALIILWRRERNNEEKKALHTSLQ